MKNRNNLIFIFLLFVAVLLRAWNIANNPPHLTPDEAALGYNAYSILQTGRDERGEYLPIVFQSFGDYKPGLYVYASTPFIFLLGLTESAVRLPSALAGIASVYLVYLIVKKLFNNERLALTALFLVAVNPWAVHFSRAAWEVNLSLALTLSGIYCFLLALRKQRYLYLSAFFFGLTLLAYQGAKLSTSLVILALFISYYKDIFKFKSKALFGSVFIGLLIVLPIVLSFLTGKTGRLAVFSIFSYPRPDAYLQAFLDQSKVAKGGLVYYLFYSEPLNFMRGIMGRYFNHFSTRFLFFVGDWQNVRHSPPYSGMMLLADLPFFILGLFGIVKNKLKKEHIFLLCWLLLAPLPAVLSRDQIHAVRALNMLVPLVIVVAFGLEYVISKLKFAWLLAVILYVYSFIYFFDSEFIHLPKKQSKAWEYGYEQIVEIVYPLRENHNEIVIQQSYAQPYIFYLFYTKYSPRKYQQNRSFVESEVGDVGQVFAIDNIKFEPIDWSVRRGQKGNLIVGDPIRVPAQDIDPSQHRVVSEIKYLDGEVAFRIIEIKNDEK